MKHIIIIFFLFCSQLIIAQNCNELYIAGVLDGTLSGGVPKMIQVCANADISDLSIYGIGSANNGNGSNGVEFTLPSLGLLDGECFTIASETSGFQSFFGCIPDAISSTAIINGDDAIELFCNANLVDIYGDVNTDGTGQAWEYMDGWASSNDNQSNINFDITEWNLSGINALDGESSNSTAAVPYPIATCVGSCMILNLTSGLQSACDPLSNTYTQEIIIEYINAPNVGDIEINGQLFPIIASPQSVILTGLIADGSSVNVEAKFLAEPTCNSIVNNLFTSPTPCSLPNISTDTISVMTYNILNFPFANNTNSIGKDASRVVYFRDIIESNDPDVIVLQELKNFSGMTMLVDELNLNGTLGYTYAIANSYLGFNGLGNGMIYKTERVNFISQTELPLNNSMNAPAGNPVFAPRGNTVYSFEAFSESCTDFIPFDVISIHLKASSDNSSGNTLSDRQRRNMGVLDALDYTDLQAVDANIIIAGDANFRSDDNTSGDDSEPGYVNLVSSGNVVDFNDPLGGFVRDQTAYADTYTQATRKNGTNHYGNGGVSGGLDDRFDFIFISDAINSSLNKMEYVPNSYKIPGSPAILGSESCDSNLPNCNDYLYMSDHYPIKIDIALQFSTCINDCPPDSLIVQNYLMGAVDTVQVMNSIEALNLISAGADIYYRAGMEINLLNGFEVESNASLHATIEECQ